MKNKNWIWLASVLLFLSLKTVAQKSAPILPGAYQTSQYLPLLKNKRVGLFTNHTATVGKKHLIDTLLTSGIQIQKVFTPEHGLRGTADAGEKTKDGIDEATGVKIVSLYGKKYGGKIQSFISGSRFGEIPKRLPSTISQLSGPL